MHTSDTSRCAGTPIVSATGVATTITTEIDALVRSFERRVSVLHFHRNAFVLKAGDSLGAAALAAEAVAALKRSTLDWNVRRVLPTPDSRAIPQIFDMFDDKHIVRLAVERGVTKGGGRFRFVLLVMWVLLSLVAGLGMWSALHAETVGAAESGQWRFPSGSLPLGYCGVALGAAVPLLVVAQRWARPRRERVLSTMAETRLFEPESERFAEIVGSVVGMCLAQRMPLAIVAAESIRLDRFTRAVLDSLALSDGKGRFGQILWVLVETGAQDDYYRRVRSDRGFAEEAFGGNTQLYTVSS